MKIYENRYRAEKERRYGEVVVKVDGGYTIMPADQYRVWKKQQ